MSVLQSYTDIWITYLYYYNTFLNNLTATLNLWSTILSSYHAVWKTSTWDFNEISMSMSTSEIKCYQFRYIHVKWHWGSDPGANTISIYVPESKNNQCRNKHQHGLVLIQLLSLKRMLYRLTSYILILNINVFVIFLPNT